jgi:hypothetical protein
MSLDSSLGSSEDADKDDGFVRQVKLVRCTEVDGSGATPGVRVEVGQVDALVDAAAVQTDDAGYSAASSL